MKVIYETGNHIVDEMGQIEVTGNVIPEAWFKTVVSANGKVNLLAINILSDTAYWYRPSEERDEMTGDVIYKKRFADKEYLQRSYKQICEKFNCSEKQAREALKVLETLGVVFRRFRTVTTQNGACPNVMYLEIVPEVLRRLTYPSDTSEDHRGCLQEEYDVFPCRETCISQKEITNTKNTTESNTKIIPSTTSLPERPVVDDVRSIFDGLGMDDRDIRSVYVASGEDAEKCRTAVELLRMQRCTVQNVVGWLIKAVQEGYKMVSAVVAGKNINDANSRLGIMPQNYDIEALERMLVKN